MQELIKIRDELVELRDKADMRSRMLVDDGREILEADRMKSEGYASAYSFAIFRIDEVLATWKKQVDVGF